MGQLLLLLLLLVVVVVPVLSPIIPFFPPCL
jgi:hypothetical protein